MPTISESQVLVKIREGPYYAVRLRPMADVDLTLSQAEEVVQKAAVRLRGWDFPHYDPRSVSNAQKYIYNATDWERHVELWRMYRSGQFIYFGAPWDLAMDHQERLRADFDREVILAHKSQKDTVAGLLSFVGLIYSVTEFYVFAARLAKSLATSQVALDVALHNAEGWALVPGDPAVPWHSFYQAGTNEIRVSEKDSEKLLRDPVAASAGALHEILECFKWRNPDATIKNWQERFMAGRFAF